MTILSASERIMMLKKVMSIINNFTFKLLRERLSQIFTLLCLILTNIQNSYSCIIILQINTEMLPQSCCLYDLIKQYFSRCFGLNCEFCEEKKSACNVVFKKCPRPFCNLKIFCRITSSRRKREGLITVVPPQTPVIDFIPHPQKKRQNYCLSPSKSNVCLSTPKNFSCK